jgi:uncharacterized protein
MRRTELEQMTKVKLLDLARKLDISGRSTLSKDGLIETLMKVQAKSRRSPFVAGKKKKTTKKVTKKVTKKTTGKVTAKKATAKKKTTKKVTAKKITAKKAVTKAPAKKTTTKKAAPRKITVVKPAAKKQAKKRSPVKVAVKKTRAAKKPAKKVAQKKTATKKAPLLTPPERPRMPERYDKDYLVLMRRDPYWLYAYWELTSDLLTRQRKRMGKDKENDRLVMRIYIHPAQGSDVEAASFDVDLPEGVESWYVNAGRSDCNYQVAIGLIGRSGRFYPLVESDQIDISRDGVSPITDEEWANQPETFRRLYEATFPAGSDPLSQGHNSAELGSLLRERFKTDWSSGMLASMGSQTLGGEQQDFWFVLDAELIVYGATEADASVHVQGRQIQLRPDGTFSLRFQLPDGTQVIDAVAVSANKQFQKTITPTVRRDTKSTEMIETKV